MFVACLFSIAFSQATLTACCFVFCGGRGSNPVPCIYYALSLPTELSSRGQQAVVLILNQGYTTKKKSLIKVTFPSSIWFSDCQNLQHLHCWHKRCSLDIHAFCSIFPLCNKIKIVFSRHWVASRVFGWMNVIRIQRWDSILSCFHCCYLLPSFQFILQPSHWVKSMFTKNCVNEWVCLILIEEVTQHFIV